jgi:hypothetical protein
MRLNALVFLLLSGCTWGCATASTSNSLEIRVRDDPNGPVRFEGPLAGPFDEMEDWVEAACASMMAQRTSDPGSLGYCAQTFISAADGEKWFISHITRMDGGPNNADRACSIPRDMLKPGEKEILALGGAYIDQHGKDENGPELWRPTLFFNQTTGDTWDHDVTVFSVEQPGVCLVYDFNGFSQVVNIWRDGRFSPIGTVYNEQGLLQPLKKREK